jgi:hypothetical protein
MSYQPIPQKEEGGEKTVRSSDRNVEDILEEILDQLKVIRLHFEVMTDKKTVNSKT